MNNVNKVGSKLNILRELFSCKADLAPFLVALVCVLIFSIFASAAKPEVVYWGLLLTAANTATIWYAMYYYNLKNSIDIVIRVLSVIIALLYVFLMTVGLAGDKTWQFTAYIREYISNVTIQFMTSIILYFMFLIFDSRIAQRAVSSLENNIARPIRNECLMNIRYSTIPGIIALVIVFAVYLNSAGGLVDAQAYAAGSALSILLCTNLTFALLSCKGYWGMITDAQGL